MDGFDAEYYDSDEFDIDNDNNDSEEYNFIVEEDIYKEFVNDDMDNNLILLIKLFGQIGAVGDVVCSGDFIRLEDISNLIFMKWLFVLKNYQYRAKNKVYSPDELIDLLMFYYSIFGSVEEACGNVHMLTGAVCVIDADIDESKKLLDDVAAEYDKEIDFDFYKIIMRYNDTNIVIYTIKEGEDYV